MIWPLKLGAALLLVVGTYLVLRAVYDHDQRVPEEVRRRYAERPDGF
jgi:hypothetical protein